MQNVSVALLCPALSTTPSRQRSLSQAQDHFVSLGLGKAAGPFLCSPQRVDLFRSFQPHWCTPCSFGRTSRRVCVCSSALTTGVRRAMLRSSCLRRDAVLGQRFRGLGSSVRRTVGISSALLHSRIIRWTTPHLLVNVAWHAHCSSSLPRVPLHQYAPFVPAPLPPALHQDAETQTPRSVFSRQ